jgi:hypothetical protein
MRFSMEVLGSNMPLNSSDHGMSTARQGLEGVMQDTHFTSGLLDQFLLTVRQSHRHQPRYMYIMMFLAW